MNIQFTISDELGKNLTALQSTLGMKGIEDLTIHAWDVLRFLIETIRRDRCTLSPEAIHWISQPTRISPSTETLQDNSPFSHAEIDAPILQEIHRLLDDDKLDQALKATHILKLLQSHTVHDSNSQLVKSEMLFIAAETFAAECDPEKAAQLTIDATHEITKEPADGSGNRRQS